MHNLSVLISSGKMSNDTTAILSRLQTHIFIKAGFN